MIGIENEIPCPVGGVVTDIEAALQRQSFRDRIAKTWPAILTGNNQPGTP